MIKLVDSEKLLEESPQVIRGGLGCCKFLEAIIDVFDFAFVLLEVD